MTRGVLASNFETIKALYLYEFMDTVSISKMYNTSSSAVSEILRRNQITSSLREELLIECIKSHIVNTTDINELHTKVTEEFATLSKKKIKYYLTKNRLSLPSKNNNDNLLSELVSGKTISDISRSHNLPYGQVRKFAQENNIEPQLIKRFVNLVDKHTLAGLLETETTETIGRHYGDYSKDVVIAAAKAHGLNFGIPSEVKEKLEDRAWCLRAYEQCRSYREIADRLKDVGADTVAYYLQIRHTIPKYRVLDEYPELQDRAFVQSVYDSKSIVQSSEEIGCTPWIFKTALESHDIPIVNDSHTSLGENKLKEFIVSLGVNIIENDRTLIAPKEIDILCPDLQIAFEYCGVYYHSSKFKSRTYHRDKLDKMNELGYHLITIYETEWMNKTELVKEKIAEILQQRKVRNVYARKTQVKNVSEADARTFLERNHIQGFTKSSVRIGLHDKDDCLVALMCFTRTTELKYNLVRFASSCRVPGGFTKLLAYFIRTNSFSEIITFADLRWCKTSNIYTKTGFVIAEEQKPAFMWVHRTGLYRREKFMKSKQRELFENFNPAITEEQNCFNNSIYKIFDCGKIKYKLESANVPKTDQL